MDQIIFEKLRVILHREERQPFKSGPSTFVFSFWVGEIIPTEVFEILHRNGNYFVCFRKARLEPGMVFKAIYFLAQFQPIEESNGGNQPGILTVISQVSPAGDDRMIENQLIQEADKLALQEAEKLLAPKQEVPKSSKPDSGYVKGGFSYKIPKKFEADVKNLMYARYGNQLIPHVINTYGDFPHKHLEGGMWQTLYYTDHFWIGVISGADIRVNKKTGRQKTILFLAQTTFICENSEKKRYLFEVLYQCFPGSQLPHEWPLLAKEADRLEALSNLEGRLKD